MGRLRIKLLIPVLAVAGVVVAGVLFAAERIYTEPGPLKEATTLVVDRGATVARIAKALQARGVIANRNFFRVAARIRGAQHNLKAGEYRFEPGSSLQTVLNILREGTTVARKVTVAEGLTSKEIVALLDGMDGLTGKVDSVPSEGSLLPDTYHFSYGDSRTEVVDRMKHAMSEVLDELWKKRASDLPFKTRAEAVVLASIVEKETALPDERPRIAALFINRLRKGMRLDADPTVVYAINDGAGPLGRPLTFADLKKDHPYNTYRHYGLPPGPICNPGRESLAAVLNPIETDELYFVADGTGGHAFARTLREHNRNVEQWRKVQRKNRIRQRAGAAAASESKK